MYYLGKASTASRIRENCNIYIAGRIPRCRNVVALRSSAATPEQSGNNRAEGFGPTFSNSNPTPRTKPLELSNELSDGIVFAVRNVQRLQQLITLDTLYCRGLDAFHAQRIMGKPTT